MAERSTNGRAPRVLRRVLALMLMLSYAGCHGWRPAGLSPQQVISDEQPSQVRITLGSGEVATVSNPILLNDSIVGTNEEGEVRIASQDIRLLEVRQLEVGQTVILSVLLGAAAAGIALAALTSYVGR